MKIFYFFNILSAFGVTLLAIVMIDYIKNVYKFEVFIEKIFRNFLRIEKSSIDFTGNFFNYLCNEIRLMYFAKISILFLLEEKRAVIEALSCPSPDTYKYIEDSFKKGNFVFFEEDFLDLMIIKNTINKKFFRGKGKLHIMPIYQKKKITAFFAFIYKSSLGYIRATKALIVNSKNLKDVVSEIITVIKEREQNINLLMVSGIKDYAFISVDSDFNITSWNKGAEVIFGYSSNDVVSKKITDFIEEEFLLEFKKGIEDVEKKDEVKLEITMKDCNNTKIIAEVLIKRIIIESVCSGYYVLVKDITKEEIWKDNIKRQAVINKSIVENSRDGIILLNEENRIIFLNEKVKNILDAGISYLGMEISHILSREIGKQILQKIDELKSTKMELVFLNLKIGDLWYNIRFFPIISMGVYAGSVIFFIDTTYVMKTREKLEEMNRNLINDLQAAKLMHFNLLPDKLPENKRVRFQSIFLPSDEIGGDFFYIDEVVVKRKRQYIAVVADVSGHGVGASMLTVLVKDVYNEFKIRFENAQEHKTSSFIKMINRKMIDLKMDGSKFVTIFILLIDVDNKTIKYSSAGHPQAIVLNSDRKNEVIGIKNSPPTGILEEINYEEEEKTVVAGDKICIYSDGILDLFSYEAEFFSEFLYGIREKRIGEIKSEIEREILKRRNNKIFQEKGKISRVDDITLILAEIL